MSIVLEKNEFVPFSWGQTTIGDLSTKIHYGYTTKSTKEKNGLKYLRITDIQNNSVKWDDVPSCQILPKNPSDYILKSDDLVFARTGATVGKSILIKNPPKSVFASYLIRIILSEKISANYVNYFFKSNLYWNQIRSGSTGMAQPNFNASKLSKIKIPLPPLNEQKRIVEKIENIFLELDDLKNNLQKTQILLKQYRKQFLKFILGGELMPEIQHKIKNEIFEKKSLEELIIKLIDHRGITPKKLGGDWVTEGIPVLSAKNIKNYKLARIDQIRFITKEMAKKWMPEDVKKGDVLMTSEGATLGELALLKDDTKYCLGQRLFGIRTDERILNNTFLYYYLISLNGQREIFSRATGSTVGGLRQTELLKLSIKFPSIPQQKLIIFTIEKTLSWIEKIEKTFDNLFLIHEYLQNVVLKQAFEGKLVPQDPNDEPAEILLQKIKQEKEQLIQKQKTSRSTKNVK